MYLNWRLVPNKRALMYKYIVTNTHLNIPRQQRDKKITLGRKYYFLPCHKSGKKIMLNL